MGSGSSTETAAFQPWQFFLVATMLAATAAVVVSRGTTLANLVLLSLIVLSVGLVAMGVHRTLAPLAAGDDRERTLARGRRARLALEREKQLVLRSIKELEFDQAMGKIADADFQDMVARLRARAIGLMKQLDEQDPDWASEVERELARRLALRAGGAAAAGVARAATVQSDVACGACGTRNDADARFCKGCGTPLATGTTR